MAEAQYDDIELHRLVLEGLGLTPDQIEQHLADRRLLLDAAEDTTPDDDLPRPPRIAGQ